MHKFWESLADLESAEAERESKKFARNLGPKNRAAIINCKAYAELDKSGLDFTFRQDGVDIQGLSKGLQDASSSVGLEIKSIAQGDNFLRVTYENCYEKNALLKGIAGLFAEKSKDL